MNQTSSKDPAGTISGELRRRGVLAAVAGLTATIMARTVGRGTDVAEAAGDTTIDGNLVFTNPGAGTRDIHTTGNTSGLRFYNADTLTVSPGGAAIQFWGNGSGLPGQAYIDAGAHDQAAVILRSAPSGGTIVERVRVTSGGQVGIGTANPAARLHVSTSTDLDAIRGFSGTTDGNGVLGSASASGGWGVYGFSSASDGTGVAGICDSGPSSTGVIAASTQGYAGFFDGRVLVNGTLAATGGKAFVIDHPLDPANQYLSHAAVEAPELTNVYSGNVTTGANGEAVVVLPAYVQAVNRDFRYQLTVVDQFAQAIVASKVQNDRFTIRTDKPRVEVSWQLTGVRDDAYARAHPFVAEQAKPAAEQGTYLNPELHGQAESKRIPAAQKIAARQRKASAPEPPRGRQQ